MTKLRRFSKRGLSLLKATLSFAIALLIAVLILPPLFETLNRSTVDQGPRPLVIVATQGGDRDYQLRVGSSVDGDGSYSFVVSMVNGDVSYGEQDTSFVVDTTITLATRDPSIEMCCEDGAYPVKPADLDDLNAGTQAMLESDALSGSRSSLLPDQGADSVTAPNRPRSATTTPEPQEPNFEEIFESIYFHEFKAGMRLLDDEFSYRRTTFAGKDYWALECTLEPAAVWRSSGTKSPTQQPLATLLAPEFTFGSMNSATDYQHSVNASLSINRTQGLQILQSFPEIQTGSQSWSTFYTERWVGNQGEPGSYVFTDPPTVITTNRDAVTAEQNLLLWWGLLLGLSVTLLVRGGNDLADAVLLRTGE